MSESRLEGPVDPEQGRLLLAKNEAAAIDLREDAGEIGHAPGAVVVLNDDLEAAAEKARAGKEVPILVFCEDGERSRTAAEKLNEAGIEAAPIAGGWQEWQASGQPVQPRSDEDFEGPDLSAAPGT